MTGRQECRGCGVVLPGTELRCPACGALLVAKSRARLIGLAVVLVVGVLATVLVFGWPSRLDPATQGTRPHIGRVVPPGERRPANRRDGIHRQ